MYCKYSSNCKHLRLFVYHRSRSIGSRVKEIYQATSRAVFAHPVFTKPKEIGKTQGQITLYHKGTFIDLGILVIEHSRWSKVETM